MDRRAFLRTVGASAGVAGVGATVAPSGDRDRVVAADLPAEGVELLTDDFGVSHVYGTDGYSVGYGQGYVQARDRLFQLDLLRLVARGESATLIGPSQLESDIEVKRDLYSESELREQWESADSESRELIEGFADGVTDRMAEMEATGELPGEFALLGRDPGAWDPLDTVAVIAYFIGFFGVSGGSERSNAKTLGAMFDRFEDEPTAWEAYGDINEVVATERHYGSLLAEEIEPTDERALDYDDVPDAQWAAIEAARDTRPWGVDEEEFDGIQDVFKTALGVFEGTKFGSNAVAVGSEHTETGRPMLAGGPQFGLLKPPVVHEIGLHGAGFDAVGVGVVGTPGIVVGRTPAFAWTGTSARDDKTDTIAVDLDPADHSRYEWDGEFHDFVTESYTHEANLWAGLVDGTTSPERVEQEVAYVQQEGTRMPVVAYNESENLVFVERTTTRMQELEGALQWLNVGRANSREEFEATLADFPFGYNFIYADDKDIGFYRTGTVPERDDGGDPRFPMPQRHHEWESVDVAREIGAWQTNPRRGYIVNWNNAPGPGWRSPDSEFEWRGAHRVDVLDRLVREQIAATDDDLSIEAIERDPLPQRASGNLTLDDVEGIIEDASVQHPFAPQIVPHLVAAARAGDERLQAVADELEAWAGAENVDRWTEPTVRRWTETEYSFRPGDDGRYPNGGMAIYEQAMHELTDVLFGDTLGPEAPTLEFDPTAGSGLSGDVDPHVADHAPASSLATLLVDALEGATAFDWLGDHGTDFRLVDEANGQAMELDTASTWWQWLFDDDEIRQAPVADRPTQRWQTATGSDVTFQTERACELRSAAHGYATAVDGAPTDRGAKLAPASSESPGRFRFQSLDDGSYRIRNADSDLVLTADEDSTVRQREWEGRADQCWQVQFAQSTEAQTTRLQEVLQSVTDRLEAQFGSEEPDEWRLENRVAEFFALGGATTDTIHITNRASYQQAIAMGEDTVAKSILPPSNTGHLNTWELLGAQFGDEPDRLTRQLDRYERFAYTPHPIKREDVEEQAVDSTQLG